LLALACLAAYALAAGDSGVFFGGAGAGAAFAGAFFGLDAIEAFVTGLTGCFTTDFAPFVIGLVTISLEESLSSSLGLISLAAMAADFRKGGRGANLE
jgi:hypothetical protein